MPQRTFPHIAVLVLSLTLMLGFPSRSYAVTLSDILAGINDLRRPANLNTLTFEGDIRLDIATDSDERTGYLLGATTLKAAWRAPDEWMVEITTDGSTSPASGYNPGATHPAFDHLLLSRPDFIDILRQSWTFEYQGTALWDGDPAWQLLVRPIDLTLDTPQFNLIVRKDDFTPLRTVVDLGDGTMASTDLTWLTVDSITLPAGFTTRFEPPIGPLSSYETTFFNHEVNPDLSGVVFPRQEGSLTIPDETALEPDSGIIAELYHGFADDPVIAPITDSSAAYTSLSFTFSLYVEDPALFDRLDDNREQIRSIALDVVSGREWSGAGGLSSLDGKWQCGEDIRARINEFLETARITDFYFLDFTPLQPGEN
jgi:hypothetical protein